MYSVFNHFSTLPFYHVHFLECLFVGKTLSDYIFHSTQFMQMFFLEITHYMQMYEVLSLIYAFIVFVSIR